MQPTSETVLADALKLPEDERLVLVSRLLETMPTEDSSLSMDDASLIDELDVRFADRQGNVAWTDLRAES